ncbi:Mur ligase family protein, partial [Bizionia echini]|uniref:Mur ligase family protein n=1 Tax=Bizionia echini TaxID=649333 RepID=UPI0030D7F5C8
NLGSYALWNNGNGYPANTPINLPSMGNISQLTQGWQGHFIPADYNPVYHAMSTPVQYIKNNEIIITIDNNQIIMPTKDIALQGKHNIKNAMAASTVAHLLKIRKQTIRESLENFHGVEHRLEQVLKINKVNYINDSKATNVNATYYALESMNAPTIWIVGGQDKGNDYQELFPFINEKVKAIICLGIDNKKLFENFESMVDIMVETQYMSEAVKIAYKIAESGDNVLLSPACASFDLFENYEDRGRQFKEAVRNL